MIYCAKHHFKDVFMQTCLWNPDFCNFYAFASRHVASCHEISMKNAYFVTTSGNLKSKTFSISNITCLTTFNMGSLVNIKSLNTEFVI